MARLPCRSSLAGFTLIEVMTVVAVIGILAAIALPNYQEYLLRAKLVEAGSTLSQARVRLEQYYQDNRSYDAKPDKPGGDCGGGAVTAKDINRKYFDYTCVTTDEGLRFTVTATGKASGGTGAFVYTIDQSNTRKTDKAPDGWNTGSCWITAKGQKCDS